ncbi:MAG: alpha/beta fold hydrolase [Alphaproteobacteria bacterium]|jgi:phospholipase/carboxylesterase
MISGPEIKSKTQTLSSIVILLHGYGADGENLISLAAELSKAFPDTHFFSPNGILPFENAPFGYQWFGLNDRSEQSMLKGLNNAAPYINQFIDYQLQKFNLSDENLALIGFSQGAMLALHTALRRTKKIGAVISFAGMLVAPQLLQTELKSKPPVSLIHGALDDVIPLPAMQMALAALEYAHIPVETIIEPMLGHSIGTVGLEFARKALKRNLGL